MLSPKTARVKKVSVLARVDCILILYPGIVTEALGVSEIGCSPVHSSCYRVELPMSSLDREVVQYVTSKYLCNLLYMPLLFYSCVFSWSRIWKHCNSEITEFSPRLRTSTFICTDLTILETLYECHPLLKWPSFLTMISFSCWTLLHYTTDHFHLQKCRILSSFKSLMFIVSTDS